MTCSGRGACGDEVPEGAWSPRRRGQRIAAALASLRAAREAGQAERDARAQARLDAAVAWQVPPGKVPAVAQVQAAALRMELAQAAQQAKVAAWAQRPAKEEAAGIRRGPGGSKPPLPAGAHFKVRRACAALEQARARAAEAERKAAQEQEGGRGPVRDITDPDARLMPVRGGGLIEGYNTQNAGGDGGRPGGAGTRHGSSDGQGCASAGCLDQRRCRARPRLRGRQDERDHRVRGPRPGEVRCHR
jgi:hypothetical protein